MLLNGRATRTVRPEASGDAVVVIDQRALPHRIAELRLRSSAEAATAISDMTVRGAPLIGVTAAYGLALQARVAADDRALEAAAAGLKAARPTAVNLAWAVDRTLRHLLSRPLPERAASAWTFAARLADDDVMTNQSIGRHGLALLRELQRGKRRRAAESAHALQRRLAGDR